MPNSLTRLKDGLTRVLKPNADAKAGEPFHGAAAPTPCNPTYVVGDIHGCFDLFKTLLAQIEQDRKAQNWSKADLVFVGDYIDRGPESAQVLAHLHDLQQQNPSRVICLKGNHEAMLLSFLESPETHGMVWLTNGGRETLQSFGLTPPTRMATPDAFAALAEQAKFLLPDDLRNWLTDLPLMWRSGDLVVAHAGLNPSLSPEEQIETDLIWGHADFIRTPRSDAVWVTYGHRITVPSVIEAGRISVDTGAFANGTLSCAVLAPGQEPRFLTAPSS